MAAEVTLKGAAAEVGETHTLFNVRSIGYIEVMPDGQRFLGALN
jgi:hypothetical protein